MPRVQSNILTGCYTDLLLLGIRASKVMKKMYVHVLISFKHSIDIIKIAESHTVIVLQ